MYMTELLSVQENIIPALNNESLLNSFCEMFNSRFEIGIGANTGDVDLIFASGRFHGLFPGDTAQNFYSGHPGIFYNALIAALCLNTRFVRIMTSTTQENGPDTEYPINSVDKISFMEAIIEILKQDTPNNIAASLGQENNESFIEFISRKVNDIDIRVVPFKNNNLYATVPAIIQESSQLLGNKPINALMITGLEYDDETGQWFNKYEKLQFDKLNKLYFLLLPRAGGISGTLIRDYIKNNDLDKLYSRLDSAGWINHRGLFDRIIADIKQSQEQPAPAKPKSSKAKTLKKPTMGKTPLGKTTSKATKKGGKRRMRKTFRRDNRKRFIKKSRKR